jgi:hypothetical protein
VRPALLLLLAVAACGDGGPDAPAADGAAPADAHAPDVALAADGGVDAGAGADAACAPAVGAAVIEHACLHVQHGPHAAVTAGSDPATVTANVNAPHTHFTIGLVGAAAPYRGAVVFRPTQDGEHAFLADPALALRITTAGGDALPVIADHDVTTCAGIARAVVVRLERLVSYRVIVPDTTAATARLIIENLESFAPEEAWGGQCP